MMEQVLNKLRSERNSNAYLPTYSQNDHHFPLSFVLSDNNQRSLDQLAKEFDK
jgi:hypothetical protein